MHVRRNVRTLTDPDPWPDALVWYARAVGELRGRSEADPEDPTGWAYMAAIHGRRGEPGGRGARFNQCQHMTWYFLPWHRIYLHYFEAVVREAIVGLGGPGDWALPYWDYSEPDSQATRTLPEAFRERQMTDGSENPLFTEHRADSVNGGGGLPRSTVDVVKALGSFRFTNSLGGLRPEFGGRKTDWAHFGTGPFGLVESLPHNDVHVKVGDKDGGWMRDPSLAALDPIFWLHHANIDRLWEVWRSLGEGRADPTDAAWRDEPFAVGRGASAVDLTPGDVVDTTAAPLRYRYDSVAVPAAVRDRLPSPPAAPPPFAMAEDPDRPAEMVGATEAPFSLTSGQTSASVRTEPPTGPAAFGMAGDSDAGEVLLQVENVTGPEPVSTVFDVFVNLPEGADPREFRDREAGRVALFGLAEATEPDGAHGGSGLTFGFDITEVARRLREAGDWDPDRVRVTFVPDEEGGTDADVTVGRVSVHRA